MGVCTLLAVGLAPLGLAAVVGWSLGPIPGRHPYRWGPSLAWQHLDHLLSGWMPWTWAAVLQAVVSGAAHAWAAYWLNTPMASELGFHPLWVPCVVLAFWIWTGCQLAKHRKDRHPPVSRGGAAG